MSKKGLLHAAQRNMIFFRRWEDMAIRSCQIERDEGANESLQEE